MKKAAPKKQTSRQYGGPGSFVPAADNGIDGHPLLSRESSTGASTTDIRRDALPSSLRSSYSSAQLDLYVPPYETVRSHVSADNVATEFAELSVSHAVSRRQSLPVSGSQRLIQDYTDLNMTRMDSTIGCHWTFTIARD